MKTTQKLTNLFIQETNFGYALKGNREISGLTTIGYFETKKQAEAEIKKLSAKARKFENIEINQIVTFEENKMIESGVVCNVENNKFTLRALRSWNNNGVIEFFEKQFNFFKTGTKTHSHHTNGNAIAIVGTI